MTATLPGRIKTGVQLSQLDLHLTALVSEQIDLFQRQLLCLTLLKQHLNHLRAAQTMHNILKRHFDVVFNVLLPPRGFKVQQVLTIGRRLWSPFVLNADTRLAFSARRSEHDVPLLRDLCGPNVDHL